MREQIIISYNKVVSTIRSSTNELHMETCVQLAEQFGLEFTTGPNSQYTFLFQDLCELIRQKQNELHSLHPLEDAKYTVLSLSGGMDSTCLLIRLLKEGKEVTCLSFDYGQKHAVEIQLARDNVWYLQQRGFKIRHIIVDLCSAMEGFGSALISDDVDVPEGHYAEDNMKLTVVPNRNAIFSAIIYGQALAISSKYADENGKKRVDISLGIHSGDHSIYPDCRPEFRDQLEKAFKLGNYDSELVSYYTPYIRGNKTSILQDCLQNCTELNLNFDHILSKTITSYNPDSIGRSSGNSGSDIERIEAFLNIGRKDPIEYQEPWEIVITKAKKILGRV